MTPDDIVAKAAARAAANRAKHGNYTDVERVQRLERQDFRERADLQAKWTRTLERPGNDTRLRPVQAEALEVAAWAAQQDAPVGMVGNIRVGGGKTLIFNLLPEVFDAKRPVLLLPPDMVEQYEEDLFFWSQRYRFRKPRVVKYSELSRPEGTDLLRRLQPDLIMADEAQALRHPSAARTKRFLRYMHENPHVRFVPMSGTLTSSTLSDYAHLCEWALRDRSPLPLQDKNVALWGSVLNADGEPDDNSWESLRWLNARAVDRRDRDALRRAFQDHFAGAAGVVTTYSAGCDADLVLRAVYPPANQDLRDALELAATEYMLPDGTEIVDALHFHRVLMQLSMGFYYVWDWPNGESDIEWLTARREWWSACRAYLKDYSREGVDSPFLVEEYVRSSGRPVSLHRALLAWDEQRHKDPPPTRAVWVDYGPVTWAYQWAMERDRCFLWWRSRAVGEVLGYMGIPVFGQGDGRPDPRRHPRAALSIAVHHKGKNYQPWADQLVLEWPSGAGWAEQLLGRTHRPGQESPVVECAVPLTTWAQRQTFTRCEERSRYIQDMTGQPQKLLTATRAGHWR